MNKKLRTNIPTSRETRKLAVPDRELLAAGEEELRLKQKNKFRSPSHAGLVTCRQRFLAIWYGYVIGEREGL